MVILSRADRAAVHVRPVWVSRAAIATMVDPPSEAWSSTGRQESLFSKGATVCYMRSVGVRELRQNASELLDQVTATGNSIEITNHGVPVARLSPISRNGGGSYAELVAAGTIRPGRGDLLSVRPVHQSPGAPSTDELLAADREGSP